jgi:miniconductance mechanosensitive channel
MFDYLLEFFLEKGFNTQLATFLSKLSALVLMLLFTLIPGLISKKLITTLFRRIAAKTTSDFDDILVAKKVPQLIGYLLPAIFILSIVPSFFSEITPVVGTLINTLEAFTGFLFILVLRGFLRTLNVVLTRVPVLKDKPIESYTQVVMIFIWFVGGILILSLLTGKSATTFLTTLGALSAVLILIFKETILGFVASIQISVNDTIRIGDWITMRNMDADGDVIAINLSSVRVQNFDKTITTIPTHKLITDPYINWRGMSESDGRRLKRQLLVKASSIHFLDEETVKKLSKVERLKGFINERDIEIRTQNQSKNVDKSLLINGRNFTNIGLYRNYIQEYLEEHPQVNQNMTVMCRQLAPTSQGVPLEIYAFISDKAWVNYEGIASDIFDHLLASAPYFDLELYELHTTSSK